jgi:hypothetical protein
MRPNRSFDSGRICPAPLRAAIIFSGFGRMPAHVFRGRRPAVVWCRPAFG